MRKIGAHVSIASESSGSVGSRRRRSHRSTAIPKSPRSPGSGRYHPLIYKVRSLARTFESIGVEVGDREFLALVKLAELEMAGTTLVHLVSSVRKVTAKDKRTARSDLLEILGRLEVEIEVEFRSRARELKRALFDLNTATGRVGERKGAAKRRGDRDGRLL
jgi:hypothetical protein